jgi:predicted amidohydrolase
MRINIAQINYDTTDMGRFKELLSDLEGITCFPECFAFGRGGVETSQYLNKVSDESESIIEVVKKTGKTVILPLIKKKHPVMRNRFYNTMYVIHNGDVIGTYKRVVIHPMEKPSVQSGKELPVFEIDGITFGVLVCFEIAFPELTRIIALKGASVIFVPASNPAEAGLPLEGKVARKSHR